MNQSNKPTAQSVIQYISTASAKTIHLLNAELEAIGWKLVPLFPSDRLPRWDAANLTLYDGVTLVRQWRSLARNQISILEAFEKFTWKRPRVEFGHYLLHLRGQKMHDALFELNRQQARLRFYYSGNRPKKENEWVAWEYLPFAEENKSEKRKQTNNFRCLGGE